MLAVDLFGNTLLIPLRLIIFLQSSTSLPIEYLLLAADRWFGSLDLRLSGGGGGVVGLGGFCQGVEVVVVSFVVG